MTEKKEVKVRDFIKWFSELDKDSGKIAGGKGANLSEIYNLKLPVPPGFVVTTTAYDFFIEETGIRKDIDDVIDSIQTENTKELEEKSKQIQKIIEKQEMPKSLQDEIFEAYESLDDNAEFLDNLESNNILKSIKKTAEPMFVAVRSSSIAEDLGDASFAGQQESYVSVKGKHELIRKIKMVFASLFTARAIYYRNKKDFDSKKMSIAVIVQKMVDSDKSGVIFSKNPMAKNNDVVIEAVFGLGDGIVSGSTKPDYYSVSEDLKLKDKKIANKEIAFVRDSAGEFKIVKLTGEISNKQVLEESEVKRLAQFALKLEEHYNKPQDIEFAIESKQIYILQTRPITTLSKVVSRKEIQNQGELLLEGLGASQGIGSGKVQIVKDLDDLDKIKKGDVLVTKMTNPDMVVAMQKAVAIVTDEGGMTAHAAIISRELGIPCVVGTSEATKKLKDGMEITVDGFEGKVYAGKTSENVIKEVLPVIPTKTKIKVIVDIPESAERASRTGLKAIGLTRLEGIIASSSKHPLWYLQNNKINEYEKLIYTGIKKISEYFDEMWIRTSDIRTDEFADLQGSPKIEANPMLGMHGIRFSLKYPEILKAEFNAMKKLSEEGKIIGIILPQIVHVSELRKTKEILKEIDFSTAKLGIMVETPAAVIKIKEFCEEGIDFVSIGTNDLTQFTFAIDRGNEQVQYLFDDLNSAILSQIKKVIKVCEDFGIESSICGQAGSKPEMVTFLVKEGMNSISVNADSAKELSILINGLEKGEELEKEIAEEEKTEEILENKEKSSEFYTPVTQEEKKEEQENKTENAEPGLLNDKRGEIFLSDTPQEIEKSEKTDEMPELEITIPFVSEEKKEGESSQQ